MRRIVTVLVLSALLIALTAGAAYAMQFRGLTDRLETGDLSDETTDALEALRAEYTEKMQAQQEQAREAAREGDREAMQESREALFALRDEVRARVQDSLTEQEQAAFCGDCEGEGPIGEARTRMQMTQGRDGRGGGMGHMRRGQ